jgi:hypothetical protein
MDLVDLQAYTFETNAAAFKPVVLSAALRNSTGMRVGEPAEVEAFLRPLLDNNASTCVSVQRANYTNASTGGLLGVGECCVCCVVGGARRGRRRGGLEGEWKGGWRVWGVSCPSSFFGWRVGSKRGVASGSGLPPPSLHAPADQPAPLRLRPRRPAATEWAAVDLGYTAPVASLALLLGPDAPPGLDFSFYLQPSLEEPLAQETACNGGAAVAAEPGAWAVSACNVTGRWVRRRRVRGAPPT